MITKLARETAKYVRITSKMTESREGYTVVPTSEPTEATTAAPVMTTMEPPSYQDPIPPKYAEPIKLPSYEQAERTKNGEQFEDVMRQPLTSQPESDDDDELSEAIIGTNCDFMVMFIISFLFGLMGYLISLCISTTLAGYYGAMAGLGLSCIKIGALYALYKGDAYYQNQMDPRYMELLATLITLVGVYLFVYGIVRFKNVKSSLVENRPQDGEA
ncbi:NEDD4 family-interacting protein 2-like [Dysidea avara]|uniref:NEDD4 family-interacting protein 2-like n=1 Tax=Dysidea avara TaxID=196820 RepID=UPI0033179B16